MGEWHRLLRRQLKRHLGQPQQVPLEWQGLVDAVSDAYDQADTDRAMLERSLDLSSAELLDANTRMRQSLSLLQATLDSTADGILVVDLQGRIVAVNRKFVLMWGIRDEVLIGRETRLALAHVREQLERPEAFLARLRELYAQPELESHDILELKDGRVIERYSQAQRIGGACVGRVWSFRDVTEHRRAEETIRHHAYHDALTGLPNRLLFRDRFAQALGNARRYKQTLAMLFFDLDRFKTINDTLGHQVGDKLLQAVTQRLLSLKRAGDTLARLGGDEFMLLASNIRQLDDAATVAENFLGVLKPAFQIDGHELHVTASAGISLFPFDGDDADTLVKHADIALYRAKERGRDNYQVYSAAMNAMALERLVMENSLRRALERDEFLVYYQPQVDARSGAIFGTEALVRWRRSDGQVLLPANFIALAEDTGLIGALGDWVLRRACGQAQGWLAAGRPPVRVAVNLSAAQFQRPSLVSEIARTLQETGLDPSLLELELTESAIMRNPDQGIASLKQLRSMGLRIAVDDFGTGYSSLSYLKRLPITALKIDGSFVRDCLDDADDAAIVTAIISMARSLRLDVLAECVETAEQAAFLQARGCDQMQGFFFSRPVEAEAFAGLLEKAPPWGAPAR